MKNQSLHQIIRGVAGAAMLWAAGLLAACSDEQTASVPDGEFYDGPLQIRANIEGTLATRTTHEAVDTLRSGLWYLSAPLHTYTSLSPNVLGVLQATFNAEGYADLKDPEGNPVTLTWNDLNPGPEANGDNYGFVLDNVPRMKGFFNNSFVDRFVRNKDLNNGREYYAVIFDDGEQTKYGAALEDETNPNENDILQGYLSFTKEEVGKKVFLNFTLRHVMARLHVELKSSGDDAVDLSQKQVKVWIDHIAAKSYGLNRGRWKGTLSESNTILIYPLDAGDEGSAYRYYTKDDAADKSIYTGEFYLFGSKDQGATMTKQNGDYYCTRNLILPPQSTHNNPDEDATLRPKIYVEVDGRTYWSYLPSVITPDGSGMESFSEFRSGWDITLKGDISGEEPYITFTAIVKDWVGVGSYILDTRQGGIYSMEDYNAAIDAFNEYHHYIMNNSLSKDPSVVESDPKKQKEKMKRKHKLERYGIWNMTGLQFTFHFFADIDNESHMPEKLIDQSIPEPLNRWSRISVHRHGHTIFGCTADDDVKKKMDPRLN